MIEVPYWWDRKLPSLAATVYNVKPDLFEVKPQGTAIPDSPPATTKKESIEVQSKCIFLSRN